MLFIDHLKCTNNPHFTAVDRAGKCSAIEYRASQLASTPGLSCALRAESKRCDWNSPAVVTQRPLAGDTSRRFILFVITSVLLYNVFIKVTPAHMKTKTSRLGGELTPPSPLISPPVFLVLSRRHPPPPSIRSANGDVVERRAHLIKPDAASVEPASPIWLFFSVCL